MPSPLFFCTSSEKPKVLNISFESDPTQSLGAQLTNNDKGNSNEMFVPAFVGIGRLLDGETIARKAGVTVGDLIVAVNGNGFRRFPPDFDDSELEDITVALKKLSMDEVDLVSDGNNIKTGNLEKTRIISGIGNGEAYKAVVSEIKQVKKSNTPLMLSLERFDWDSRVHSWGRFLTARDGNVPDAMKMLQTHEAWREDTFPIDLTDLGIQKVLRSKAVSEVDITQNGLPPTVYVNFGELQSIKDCKAADVTKAFVIFTEELLKRAKDPRSPKTCQFIDLTGVSLTGGMRTDVLRQIYGTFEPNYPETLQRMIMYPVSKYVASTAGYLLSFVNANTRKKFLITDDLCLVCKELGWSKEEVEACGGVTGFMKKYSKAGASMIFG